MPTATTLHVQPRAATTDHAQQFARLVFAVGMLGLGTLAFVFRDFAMQWQPVPAWVPGRAGLAYASGALMLGAGAGLLFNRAATASARILFAYVVLWELLLKVPRAIAAPRSEASWLGVGEIGVLMLGGWLLFASLATDSERGVFRFAASERGRRVARMMFGLALPAIGLSHFVYATQTAALVPAWLPYRLGWAYLTGAGQIAAALGVLFSVYPRLAATMEAAMLSIFTVLVWVPGVLGAPTDRLQWTAYAISWAISAAAWVVAASFPPGVAAKRR